jgi:hypothetical protein
LSLNKYKEKQFPKADTASMRVGVGAATLNRFLSVFFLKLKYAICLSHIMREKQIKPDIKIYFFRNKFVSISVCGFRFFCRGFRIFFNHNPSVARSVRRTSANRKAYKDFTVFINLETLAD